jgi:hypothetical protein
LNKHKMTKYVAQRAPSRNVYHTSETCYLLSDDYREASAREISVHEYRECKACAGTAEKSTNTGMSL